MEQNNQDTIFTCSDSCQVYGSILLCSVRLYVCMYVCMYVCTFYQFSGLAQLSIMLHGYLDIMDIL